VNETILPADDDEDREQCWLGVCRAVATTWSLPEMVAEPLEKAQQHSADIDLLLADANMPIFTDVEVAHQLRASRNPHTASSAWNTQSAARRAGWWPGTEIPDSFQESPG